MATLLSTQTQKTKHYQTDQQVKYLHLEAEIDILLQKVTAFKEQKQYLGELTAQSSDSVK
ncbi:MAG: hypothetical protein ACRC8K_20980 [Waterburya sp.]